MFAYMRLSAEKLRTPGVPRPPPGVCFFDAVI